MSFVGQAIDDILLSKISDKVGTVKQSMLGEAAFNVENPGTWVLMDGRSCAGSAYATLTGNTNVPDMLTQGTFLRQASSGKSTGTFEEHQSNGISHVTYNGYSTQGGRSPVFPESGYVDWFLAENGSLGMSSRLYIHGRETRPKNIAVNHFIKIEY